MALWDTVTSIMALAPWAHEPVLQTRDVPTEGSLADFIARTQGVRERPWRVAGVTDALAVPAIFRAITLISNVVGSLTVNAERNGEELPGDQRPRLIIRPNPFATPREFYRETAWSMASYGEAWWWVAARDVDDSVMSLIPVHPREVLVTENPDDLRFPVIEWRNKQWSNREIIQVKMTGEPGALRGKGPLQACGATVSVSVEAQEWAANFYAEGGLPNIWVKTGIVMSDEDIDNFQSQWVSKAHNRPRFTDPGVDDIKEIGVNEQGAQMLTARDHQNGEAARMFGIPGALLEYSSAGSSLTYANRQSLWGEFTERCLLPDYLEPIEQAMSDLLTRSTIARFNTEGLLRADFKTRADVSALLFEKLVIDQTEARQIVGLEPTIENQPVPFAPPAAFPPSIPTRSLPEPIEVRCSGKVIQRGLFRDCGRLLGKFAAPYEVVCSRCKTVAVAA